MSLICSDNVLVKGKRLGDRRGVFESVPFGTSGHFTQAACPSCTNVFVEFVFMGEELEWGNIFDSVSVLSPAQAECDADTSYIHGFESDTFATRTQSRVPATTVHVWADDERDDRSVVIRRVFLRDWGLSETPVSPPIVQPCQRALTFRYSEEECLCAGYLLPPIELDAVRSLAGSRPFFVNLGEMDAIAVPPIGEESFLSLSNSPDGLIHHPLPRRERPVSMPLPRSRHSSLHHRTWETRRERDDCGWMLEGSSPELKSYEFGDEEIRLDDERDWRQFHVDWVRSIR